MRLSLKRRNDLMSNKAGNSHQITSRLDRVSAHVNVILQVRVRFSESKRTVPKDNLEAS